MIGIIFCFKNNTFTSRDIVSLLSSTNALDFVPKKFTSFTHGLNGVKYQATKHLEMICEMNELGFSFESDTYSGPKFSTYEMKSFQMLRWELDIENFNELDLASFYEKDGFSVGYCFDLDYVFWQSEKSLSAYEYWNKPYQHLRTYYDKSLDMTLVDISGNPGKMTRVNDFWLMSCWRMYFGSPFFHYVPKEKLHSFQEAKEIQEVSKDVLLVELYENVFESDKPKNQELQRKFRNWIGMNELERLLT